MHYRLAIVTSILLLTGCQKEQEIVPQQIIPVQERPISFKASISLMEFEQSHSNKRSGFPSFGERLGQSPIDIPEKTRRFESTDPVLHYERFSLNNQNLENFEGENLKVEVTGDNYITIKGKRYDLLKFHFHRNSEHALKGKKFDMEVHLVHASWNGELAVLGVFLEQIPRTNEQLETLFKHLPELPNQKVSVNQQFHPLSLLPRGSGSYFTYSGSLTTPTFTENLTWIVFESPNTVSKEQVHEYAEVFEELNVRPLQPISGRTVWEAKDYRIR